MCRLNTRFTERETGAQDMSGHVACSKHSKTIWLTNNTLRNVVNPPPLFRAPLSLISGSKVQIFAGVGVFGGVVLF